MHRPLPFRAAVPLALAALIAAGCDWFGSPGLHPGPGHVVSGIAAAGSGLSGAPDAEVALHDALGASVRQQAAAGAFRLDVAGLTPPFLLQASFPGGPVLFALAGVAGRCNVNPLTDAATAGATGGRAAALFQSPDPAPLRAALAALPAALAALRAQLAPLGAVEALDPFLAGGDGLGGLAATVAVDAATGTVVVHGQAGATIYLGAGRSLAVLSWTGRTAGANDPQVAVDAGGGAVVVWSEPAGDHWDVRAQRRTPAGRWEASARVSDGVHDASAPVVGVDADGSAWVAWCQWDGTDATIRAAHRLAGGAWEAPVAVDARAGFSGAPRLAVNPAGDAALVWHRQVPGPRTDAWVSRLAAGGSWGPPELLSDQVSWAMRPEVVVGRDGAVTAAWTQAAGMRQTLWSAGAAAGQPFGAAGQLSTAGRDAYGQTALASDGAGQVVALWGQAQVGSGFVPWAARRAADGTWAAAEQVGDGNGDAYFPSVSMNASGAALAAWKQSDGTAYRIHAARLDPAAGWGADTLLEEGAADADYPSAGLDAAGDGVVAWSTLEGTAVRAYSARFLGGGGWQAPALEQEAAATLPAGMGFYPLQLGINAAGIALVAWAEDSM